MGEVDASEHLFRRRVKPARTPRGALVGADRGSSQVAACVLRLLRPALIKPRSTLKRHKAWSVNRPTANSASSKAATQTSRRLVAINKGRAQVSAGIAAKTGASVADAAAGETLISKVPAGRYHKTSAGGWAQK